jgi:hypothetical protein
LLHRLKWLKIIKVHNGLTFNLLHEGSDIGLIFQWQLDITLNLLGEEAEFKLDVHNVVGVSFIASNLHILSVFEIFRNFGFAVFSRIDAVFFKPISNFGQSPSSSHSCDLLISYLQKDAN